MPLPYPSECSSCPYKFIGKGFCPPDRPHRETKIVFYGEAPGADEVRLGQGFVGRAGGMLRICALRAGLHMQVAGKGKMGEREVRGKEADSEVACANVLLCRPPLNKFPDDSVALECMRRHEARHRELIENFPVIAFGGNTARVLSGGIKWQTKAEHGSLSPFRSGLGADWFTVSIHPSYLVRQGGDGEEKVESSEGGKGGQFQLAPLLSTVIAGAQEQAVPMVPKVQFMEPEAAWALLETMEPRTVAVDIEGQGGNPVLLGLCWDPASPIVLWWGEETRALLSWLFGQAGWEFVFHNAAYDVPELAEAKVNPPPRWSDTINLAALIDPSPVGFFGLQQQSLIYVPGAVAWKGLVNHDDLSDDGDKVQRHRGLWKRIFEKAGSWPPSSWQGWFGFYNGLDTSNTLRLYWAQKKVLGARGWYYENFMQPLQKPLLEMGVRGMPVDPARLVWHRRGCLRLERMARGIVREAGTVWVNRKKELVWAEVEKLEKEREQETRAREAIGLGKRGKFSKAKILTSARTKARTWLKQTEINLGSPVQKSEFLGEWLGIPLPKTKSRKFFSTREDHLQLALLRLQAKQLEAKHHVGREEAMRVLRACIAGSVWGTWRRNFLEAALRRVGMAVKEEESGFDLASGEGEEESDVDQENAE